MPGFFFGELLIAGIWRDEHCGICGHTDVPVARYAIMLQGNCRN